MRYCLCLSIAEKFLNIKGISLQDIWEHNFALDKEARLSKVNESKLSGFGEEGEMMSGGGDIDNN